MPPAQIFISYRRDDTAGYARALYDALAREFGDQRVFIDVDDIGAGQPFGEVIEQQMGQSAVLLVLIGQRWWGEREGQPPRLHDPADLVRREVARGLALGMQVIPLLFDAAAMPGAAQLPAELAPLAARNALEISHTRFAADMARLLATLRSSLGASASPSPANRGAATTRRAWWWLPIALALAAAVLVLVWLGLASKPPAQAITQPGAGSSATPSLRAAVNGVWQAEVNYDWPNAHYTERFNFSGEGAELHGSASFLRVARGLLEGRVSADGLQFVTRTQETTGSGVADTVHRYQGRSVGDELHFVMQTEGGSSVHQPVAFVARRAAAAASAP